MGERTQKLASKVAQEYVVAKGWAKLPNGWTNESVKKFWDSLTGEKKHKVTECIEKMDGKVPNPGAFCAGACDIADPGWREKK